MMLYQTSRILLMLWPRWRDCHLHCLLGVTLFLYMLKPTLLTMLTHYQ